MSNRTGSLLALRDRHPAPSPAKAKPESKAASPIASSGGTATGSSPVAPSRQGTKAMTGYFSPEMSYAMHLTARKPGMSLQDAMAESFHARLRKLGARPVGM